MVSSTEKLSVLADAFMVSTYIYVRVQYCSLYLFIYQVYFLFGDMDIRARFTAVYAYIYILYIYIYVCNYSGMYAELCYYV